MRFEIGGRSSKMESSVSAGACGRDLIREDVSGHTTCIRSIDLMIS